MGCGTSKSPGGPHAVSPPGDKAALASQKSGSMKGDKKNIALERVASLGNKPVVSSFTVTTSKKSRESDAGSRAIDAPTAPATTGATAAPAAQQPAPAAAHAASEPPAAALAAPPPLHIHTTHATRPSLQVRRTAAGPWHLLDGPVPVQTTDSLPADADAHKAHLAAGAPADQQLAGAKYFRGLTTAAAPVSALALAQGGVLSPLVALIGGSSTTDEVKSEALWAVGNAAAGGFESAQAVSDAGAPAALASVLAHASGSILELALWTAGNIAGAVNAASKKQELAPPVIDAALKPAIAAAKAGLAALPGDASLLRAAVWCLYVLTKHKREKEMVDAVPVLNSVLLSASADAEVLTCGAWAAAHLAANPDNAEFMKQVLEAVPRLALWVRDPSVPALCTPALLAMGALCTGYGAQDYSSHVVEAGGVPAMLAFLKRAATAGDGGGPSADMRHEALFALSNVAGSNSATVQAMLDAGAFEDVTALIREPGLGAALTDECLYVLANPLTPHVAADFAVTKALVKSGLVQVLTGMLANSASLPTPTVLLLLNGINDALKKGQQLLKWGAEQAIFDGTPAPTSNPMIAIFQESGTLDKLQELKKDHADEDVRSKAHALVNILAFL